MDIGTFRGVITAVLFVAFIGLLFWAFSSRRRADFDAAARLPLDEKMPAHSDDSVDGEALR